jgi:hypothetical protein
MISIGQDKDKNLNHKTPRHVIFSTLVISERIILKWTYKKRNGEAGTRGGHL